ncbi:hypothetical protein PDE_02887 [Penicillium oxalicum 114-2]|uniref:C2H2-type domain-containing protein n=1 Tax=Penicillium oxalicum (strain 114-2 / CGMCC 5302) TaxID=933388 RepID=S8APT3_PENO1|nr:hypothetical protein PDE_02887 [Penicillium oxalicum 114-2]
MPQHEASLADLLTAEDFDKTEVLLSSNPHPVSGYAHGPIPNNNPGWLPQSIIERSQGGDIRPQILARDIEAGMVSNPPANPMVAMNRTNGLVCDVEVAPGIMCGYTYNTQATLRKHLRNEHPGATINLKTQSRSPMDARLGRNALKLWVLTGGWRRARYQHEPGAGSDNSLIREYCNALERIAREDPEFASRWGTMFHRPACAASEDHEDSGAVVGSGLDILYGPSPSRS